MDGPAVIKIPLRLDVAVMVPLFRFELISRRYGLRVDFLHFDLVLDCFLDLLLPFHALSYPLSYLELFLLPLHLLHLKLMLFLKLQIAIFFLYFK